ncbi:MAG TPA: nitrilase-related carbon-nitrogen hydrolase [Tenuifilaceae bacterium]|nr:nitrilase-related carbon-nitrogen hydrolase [Tenuifilaceae bacterium]HPQ34949.1 nitrilase-related carbon-nitrogen hydrolase [Tenuifilaceae bacterium]
MNKMINKKILNKRRIKISYINLLIGFIFLFFFNGRWILPIAAFVAPIFLIRFLRFQKPFIGFLIIVLAGWVSNIFVWKGMLPMSGFFYYLVSFIMSVITSLTFLLDRIYAQKFKGIVSTLIFPSVYVIMDYINILANPSGSYGTLVHTQSSLPLLQLVSITGIWGVIFLITWTASIINWLWDNHFERNKVYSAFGGFGIPFLVVILWGQIRLSTTIDSPTVRIASINSTKTEYHHRLTTNFDSLVEEANQEFLRNCETAASSGAKIIFGRETIISLPVDKETDFIEKAKTIALCDSIYIGIPMHVIPKKNSNENPENKIIWISPTGEILFTYHKAKPTYPGECDYGDGIIKYFDSPYGRVGSAICFDMDFSSLISQTGKMDIDIMLVPGSDWKEISPYHTYVASLRGIENGFNIVRSTFKGFSASFNYKGQLLSSNDFFNTDEVILYSDVPVKGQKTIYSFLGDYFAWLCIIFFLSMSFVYIKKKWINIKEK